MSSKKTRGSKFKAWIETGDAVLDEPEGTTVGPAEIVEEPRVEVGQAYFEPNIKPGTAEIMSGPEEKRFARELALKKLKEKRNAGR